jgi:peptide/nickel transport system permease protein
MGQPESENVMSAVDQFVGGPVTGMAVVPPRRAPGFWRRFRGKPLGVAGLVVAGIVILGAVLAPWLAPYGPNVADLARPLTGPSGQHWLGTDSLGRDILSRLIWGARPTLMYAVEPVAVSLLIGLPVGLAAGYLGGRFDRTAMWLTDVGLSVPGIVLLLIVLAIFGEQFWLAVAFFGVLTAPPLIRLIRGATLAVRKELFIDAALVAGRSHGYIVRRHVLPRVRGPVLVQATLLTAGSVVLLAGLGYLGYGPQPPNPTWGSMITESQQVLAQSPWLLITSGGVTALMVLSLGVVGDAIRDASVEAWAETPAGRRVPPAASAPALAAEEPPAAAARPILAVRDLSIAFDRKGQEVVVVDGVSFDIAAGEAVALVGESGCGKTTVAASLVRLLRGNGRIVSGSLRYEDRDVLALDGQELRRFRGSSIGYISQEPMAALDPNFRIGWQLAEVIRSHQPMPKHDVERRVAELLELVQLPDPARVARSYPHELSGGMAQRVSIARALARNPRVLIADEPTTALDVTVQAEILTLLRTLRSQTGLAILLISHDWGVVSHLCDRALVMYAGQVVEQGPLAELLRSPAHPYTRGLLVSRPDTVPADASVLPMIPGTVPEPEKWPAWCRFAERCDHATDICRTGPVASRSVSATHHSRCVHSSKIVREPFDVSA